MHLLNEMPKATSQIGPTLKEWRTAAKLSQAAAGREIGVDAMTVSRWERGVIGRLKTENAVAIAKAYKKPTADVLRLFGLEADAGVLTQTPKRGAAVRTKEEVSFIVGEVRRKAALFNVRRAAGAPEAELKHLTAELKFSIRAGIEVGASDEHSLELIINAFFELMTAESRPAKPAAGHKSQQKAG